MIDINDLTIGQAKALAAQFAECASTLQNGPPRADSAAPGSIGHDRMPVLVCTDKRGVVFGYTKNHEARPIKMTDARMCLYWSVDVGGVFGLAEKGPTKGCKISATAGALTLEGVTAVFEVDDAAVSAWVKAPVQGR